MTEAIPGFTAEASLFRTRTHFRSTMGLESAVGIRPAWILWQFSEIQLSWQPSTIVAGFGDLTIKGDYFAPDADVMLTVSNCGPGGVPCRQPVHTSKGSSVCRPDRPWECFYFPGGSFQYTVPMGCGGDSTVNALDLTTGEQTQGSINVNC